MRKNRPPHRRRKKPNRNRMIGRYLPPVAANRRLLKRSRRVLHLVLKHQHQRVVNSGLQISIRALRVTPGVFLNCRNLGRLFLLSKSNWIKSKIRWPYIGLLTSTINSTTTTRSTVLGNCFRLVCLFSSTKAGPTLTLFLFV